MPLPASSPFQPRHTFSRRDATANTRTLTIRATDTSAGAAGETTTEETITIEVTAPLTIALQTSATGGATTITIEESDDTAIAITALSLATAGVTLADTNPYVIQGAAPAGVTATIADDGAITARVDYDALTADHQMNGIPVIVEVTGSESGQSGTINLIIMVTNLDDENPEIGAIPTGITVEAGTTTLSAPIDIDATDDFTTAANTGDPEAEISYAFVDDRWRRHGAKRIRLVYLWQFRHQRRYRRHHRFNRSYILADGNRKYTYPYYPSDRYINRRYRADRRSRHYNRSSSAQHHRVADLCG